MGDVPRPPDGPPLSHREALLFRLQLANGITEAYAAAYRDPTGEFVTVYAFTRDEANAHLNTQMSSTELPRGVKFTLGATDIVIGNKGSPCYEAVVGYVREITTR
jgi:hypothetical protein